MRRSRPRRAHGRGDGVGNPPRPPERESAALKAEDRQVPQTAGVAVCGFSSVRAVVLGRVVSWATGYGRNPKEEEPRSFWNAKLHACIFLIDVGKLLSMGSEAFGEAVPPYVLVSFCDRCRICYANTGGQARNSVGSLSRKPPEEL